MKNCKNISLIYLQLLCLDEEMICLQLVQTLLRTPCIGGWLMIHPVLIMMVGGVGMKLVSLSTLTILIGDTLY